MNGSVTVPIPLLVIAAVLAASGSAGTATGVKGGTDLAKARRIVKDNESDYTSAYERYTAREAAAADTVLRYNQFREDVQTTTLTDWVSWLTSHERQVRRLPHETVTGVKLEIPDLPRLQRLVSPGGIAADGVKAAVAGVAAQQAALAAVRAFAAAGTGAAISGLSGAAAQSATLAWLGGGTLAAGGGGVAAGGLVLTGVAIAPAMLLAGISLAVRGEKALTSAEAYRKDARTAIAHIDAAMELFDKLDCRIAELSETITRTNSYAEVCLHRLSALDFDPEDDDHVEAFQKTALHMRALSELLQAPLSDDGGQPDTQGETK